MRRVDLPKGVPGALFVSSMPGRDGAVDEAIREMRESEIDRVICLTPEDEIRLKSPGYAAVLERSGLPCEVQRFPIVDFGVPEDRDAFVSLVGQLRDRLREGGRLLVHCSAGFGRSGMVATYVLVALGVGADMAREAVEGAGSRPEHDLVGWMAENAGGGDSDP